MFTSLYSMLIVRCILGINMGVNMLGPAFAATVGSRFLNIYVDVGRVDMDE